MILDQLNLSPRYEQLNPLFKKAFDYLKETDLSTLEAGKYILEENALIINVNETGLKSPENARMEIHDEYIDIHIPLSRTERFSWSPRALLASPSEEFNRDKDARHYADAPQTFFDVAPGQFVLFFPEDAHAGCIGEGSIRKIVLKVKAN